MALLFGKKKEEDRRYFIYFYLGRVNGRELESGDFDLGKLGLENLTLEQAKKQLLKIKEKIRNRDIDIIRNGKELLIWGAVGECFISEE